MRTAFFRIENGTTVSNNRIFLDFVFKAMCEKRRIIIPMAVVERMPLHSLAISIVMPGKEKVNPSLSTGTLARSKKRYTKPADPACKL